LPEVGFGIEFALKRSYFYTLIDVSETIFENTFVDVPDFASIATGGFSSGHGNRSKISAIFSVVRCSALADGKNRQLEVYCRVPVTPIPSFVFDSKHSGPELARWQNHQKAVSKSAHENRYSPCRFFFL